MRMKHHVGLAVLALVLSSGTALAQTTIITQEPAMPGTIVTTAPAQVVAQPLDLTPQPVVVYPSVVDEPTVIATPPRPVVVERTVTPVSPPVQVVETRPVAAAPLLPGEQAYAAAPGAVVTTQISAPAQTVAAVQPATPYTLMTVNRQTVLVDPATSMVVGEVVQ